MCGIKMRRWARCGHARYEPHTCETHPEYYCLNWTHGQSALVDIQSYCDDCHQRGLHRQDRLPQTVLIRKKLEIEREILLQEQLRAEIVLRECFNRQRSMIRLRYLVNLRRGISLSNPEFFAQWEDTRRTRLNQIISYLEQTFEIEPMPDEENTFELNPWVDALDVIEHILHNPDNYFVNEDFRLELELVLVPTSPLWGSPRSFSFPVVSIESLPEHDRKCFVCLEKYGDSPDGTPAEEPVKLPCGHSFGQNCITKWLKTRQSCPICRRNSFGE